MFGWCLSVVEEMKEKYINYDLSYDYRHITAILDDNFRILSIGTNTDRSVSRYGSYTRHSEMDSIIRFRRKYHNKKNKKHIKTNKPLNIFVIRVSVTGVLGLSKPCKLCMNYFSKLEKLGYKIKNIFYSEKNGSISKNTIKSLKCEVYQTNKFRKFNNQKFCTESVKTNRNIQNKKQSK